MDPIISNVVARHKLSADLRTMLHNPSQADDLLTNAYQKLIGFKLGFDAMEEIPSDLRPYYNQVLMAMDAVGNAQKRTYQLRMMTRKLAK